uniref:Uncharacterized protein MANES_12G083500 n=1 Tax=Rhizophora mucronata TaxID=61149 RepID=A0A2P2QT31_RHIMU
MYWNFYHWTVGYVTVILSVINIYEGFDVLNGQKNWKGAYTGIIIFLGATAVLLEAFTWFIVLRRKRAVSSDKDVNGENGVNGSDNKSHQTV